MQKLMIAMGVCASLSIGFADTLTWKGGTGGSWSEPLNWTSSGSNTVPKNGDSVVLSGTSVNDLGSTASPLQLAGLTVSGNVTLTGNPLAFPNAGSQISYSGGTFTCGVKISVTTDSGEFYIKGESGATLVANADIVAKSDLKLNLFGKDNVFNGKLSAGQWKSLISYVNNGQCVYNGPVSCYAFCTGRGSEWKDLGAGVHVFGSSANAIGHDVQDWRCTMKAAAPNIFKGDIVDLGYTHFEGNADFYLQGYDQEIDRFTAPDPANNWSIKTDIRADGHLAGGRIISGSTAGNVPRLTCRATKDSYFVGKIEGDLKLVWHPTGDWTFVVSNRTQQMTTPITVSNGTFAVEGGNVNFPNLTGIEVAPGAKLRVGTTDAQPFPVMTSLTIAENGRLVCAADGAARLSTGVLNVELADGAQVEVASGKLLTVKTLTLSEDDLPVAVGLYTGGAGDGQVKHADWIDGEGQVFVSSMKDVDIKTSTWKGGAANDNLTTAANWKDGETPNFLNGSAQLVLAESGTHAVVDQSVMVNGITDTMSGEFVLDAVAGAKIQLLGGGIASSGAGYQTGKSLTINADVEIASSQTWTAYDNLVINGRLSSLTGGERLTLDGPGIFYLTGSNTFAGPVDFKNGRFEIRGDSPFGDSDQPLIIDGMENSRNPALYLKDAHVKRPVQLTSNHQYYYPITSVQHTTNVLEKAMTLNSGVKRVYIEQYSTLVFADGIRGGGILFDPSGEIGAWLVFRGTALDNFYLYADGGGNLAFESAGNRFHPDVFFCPQPNNRPLLIETRVENAFTADCPMRMGGPAAQPTITATWDLCGHNQQCGNFRADDHVFVTSASPATLTVNQVNAITNKAVFQGAVSLVKAGAGLVELTSASTATGAVTVAAGTLKFGTGSGWLVGQPRRSRNDFTVQSGAKLELAEGVAINVRELYLPTGPDGALVRQDLGTWGSSSSGAKNKNDTYFSGKGQLNVIGDHPGMILVIE